MNAGDLSGKSIAFAGSGGLDSCTITRWLSNQGVRVVCFTADFAQPDEKSLDDGPLALILVLRNGILDHLSGVCLL